MNSFQAKIFNVRVFAYLLCDLFTAPEKIFGLSRSCIQNIFNYSSHGNVVHIKVLTINSRCHITSWNCKAFELTPHSFAELFASIFCSIMALLIKSDPPICSQVLLGLEAFYIQISDMNVCDKNTQCCTNAAELKTQVSKETFYNIEY